MGTPRLTHDWYDPVPNIPAKLLMPMQRKCRTCGAEQVKEDVVDATGRYRKRWGPPVGRCRPSVWDRLGSL